MGPSFSPQAAKTVDGVTYPVHDFFDAGTLVASKIPTDFANSWTYVCGDRGHVGVRARVRACARV